MDRPTLPVKTVKILCARSQHRCAFPGCTRPLTGKVEDFDFFFGEICHIEGVKKKAARYNPKRKRENLNDLENLILLCPEHHKVVDELPEKYPADRLREFKASHELSGSCDINIEDRRCAELYAAQQESAKHVGRVYAHLTHNEVHNESKRVSGDDNSININSSGNSSPHVTVNQIFGKAKQKPSVPEEGTIGKDPEKRSYAKYLCKKLIGYKAKTNRITTRQAGIIVANKIDDKFGAPLTYVAIGRYEELVDFLQTAIDNTIAGRAVKKKGKRAYKIQAEFLNGYRANTISGPGT